MPFESIKSINSKKYQEDISKFNPFLTNKLFANDETFVQLASILNGKGFSKLPKRAIYDCYFYAIPKNRKFIKYPKGTKTDEDVKLISSHFQVNEIIAKRYLTLLPDSAIKEIRKERKLLTERQI